MNPFLLCRATISIKSTRKHLDRTVHLNWSFRQQTLHFEFKEFRWDELSTRTHFFLDVVRSALKLIFPWKFGRNLSRLISIGCHSARLLEWHWMNVAPEFIEKEFRTITKLVFVFCFLSQGKSARIAAIKKVYFMKTQLRQLWRYNSRKRGEKPFIAKCLDLSFFGFCHWSRRSNACVFFSLSFLVIPCNVLAPP